MNRIKDLNYEIPPNTVMAEQSRVGPDRDDAPP